VLLGSLLGWECAIPVGLAQKDKMPFFGEKSMYLLVMEIGGSTCQNNLCAPEARKDLCGTKSVTLCPFSF